MKIKDVAKRAGVSTATVSRVLNHPEKVKEETRKKVLRAIKEMDYFPNHIAKMLRVKKTGFIAMIIPEKNGAFFEFPYFGIIMKSISKKAKELNYNLIISSESGDDLEIYKDFIMKKLVDGFIVVDTKDSDKRIKFLKENKINFVVIGRPTGVGKYVYVDSDNVGGAFEAVNYLLETGHEKVAFINGPADHSVSRQRLKGYMEALEKHGKPFLSNLILNGDFTEECGYKLTRELIKKSEVDAIFFAGDSMAIGGIKYLKEIGIKIGKEISVIGFDDIPAASNISPSLSSVRQPISEIGESVVSLLIGMINGEKVESVIFPTELVIRESVRRKRK